MVHDVEGREGQQVTTAKMTGGHTDHRQVCLSHATPRTSNGVTPVYRQQLGESNLNVSLDIHT
jgi:hypothetical protein